MFWEIWVYRISSEKDCGKVFMKELIFVKHKNITYISSHRNVQKKKKYMIQGIQVNSR